MNITLIAYRPNSYNFDNGITSSDHEIHTFTDAANCAHKIAQFKAMEYKDSFSNDDYEPWELTILFDGIPAGDDVSLQRSADTIREQAELLAQPLKAAIDQKREEAARAEQERQAQLRRQQLERDLSALNELERKLGRPITKSLPQLD